MQQLQQDTTIEAIKSVPPVLFSIAWFKGLTISDVVALITLVYLIAQIGLLVPKYITHWREWRRNKLGR